MVQLNLDSRHLAKTYDEVSDSQFENGKLLIEKLLVEPGDTVLDIGAGTGRLGLHVLERIGPTGRFIGIDPLEERIRIANERNRFPHAVFRVGVGEELGFIEDNSVDVVYLSAVFHWITDKPKALSEIFRVLKPGGRIGLTTGARELAHIATFRTVTDRVLKREPYSQVVNLADYATARHGVTTTGLIELFLAVGLGLTSIEVSVHKRTYPTGRDIVDFLESSTFGNYLNHVPQALRDRARQDVIEEFDSQRGDGGVEFVGYTIFAVAEKPSSASFSQTAPLQPAKRSCCAKKLANQ